MNADTFSRLPLSTTLTSTSPTGDTVLLFECLSVAPLSVNDTHRGTDRDPILSKIWTYALQGCPSSLTQEELQPYWHRPDEISVIDHILLWGSRVIVPPKARVRVLEVFHSTHPGVSGMQSLARSYSTDQMQGITRTRFARILHAFSAAGERVYRCG